MIKKFVYLFFLIIFFGNTLPVLAAKPSISVSTSYIRTRNIVRAFFGNMNGVSKVSYTMMYEGNGVGQGVMGSFSPGKNKSISRDLYLGTCSGKVCTPQRNIKNIQIEVITKFTNNTKSSKVYNVKM